MHDGTIGANNISPIDVMAFFLTLAYIAISLDASGLIRYLAYRVLRLEGKKGHRLYFYMYAFFYCLATVLGNDPIILSGTPFIAYMARVSSNIKHPRAWIYAQFAIANIASATLVSSNPTNLVLAGAFNVKFIDYTANMIVPVLVTAIVLFPCLLYLIFSDSSLIPVSITMHELAVAERDEARTPITPHRTEGVRSGEEEDLRQALSLEETTNPFLEKWSAAFAASVMVVALITVLVLNASSREVYPVFWVTAPAAFVTLCWDVASGWHNGNRVQQTAHEERSWGAVSRGNNPKDISQVAYEVTSWDTTSGWNNRNELRQKQEWSEHTGEARIGRMARDENQQEQEPSKQQSQGVELAPIRQAYVAHNQILLETEPLPGRPHSKNRKQSSTRQKQHGTLVSHTNNAWMWSLKTFPTVTTVVANLPFALIPFAFAMFILVQALVTNGWIPIFAHGWNAWAGKTGTVGCIGGMAFLSVILCNVNPSL